MPKRNQAKVKRWSLVMCGVTKTSVLFKWQQKSAAHTHTHQNYDRDRAGFYIADIPY